MYVSETRRERLDQKVESVPCSAFGASVVGQFAAATRRDDLHGLS